MPCWWAPWRAVPMSAERRAARREDGRTRRRHVRLHHATRGAWQLLPFIRAARQHDLSPIGRWTLIDSLRRSLVAPMSLLLMLLVIASGVVPLTLALAVIAAAGCAGPLADKLARLAPGGRPGGARWASEPQPAHRLAGRDRARRLDGGAAAARALLQVDAIGRALHRQYRVAAPDARSAAGGAHCERPSRRRCRCCCACMAVCPIAAAVIGTGLWLVLDRALAVDGRAWSPCCSPVGCSAPVRSGGPGDDRPPPRAIGWTVRRSCLAARTGA